MATRSLNVQITGDARPLGVATDKAGRHIGDLEKRGHRMGKVLAGGFAAAGVAAAGALVVGLKKSVDAAMDAEKSQARLTAQLKASGISYKNHSKQIDEVIQKHSQLAGLDDEDLQDAFTNIVRVTGNVNKSLKLTGLAADFARAKHMDVAKAGELVGKVAGGNTGILKRYGVQIDKGATATEALGKLQEKFAGQAEAYGKTAAGAQERFGVAVENLQEKIGSKLLPIVTDVTNKVADFVAQMESGKGAGGRFAKVAEDAFGKIKKAAEVLWPVLRAGGGAALDLLRKGFERIKVVIEALQPGFDWIKSTVWPAIREGAEAVVPVVVNAFEKVQGAVLGAFTAIRDSAVGHRDEILEVWRAISGEFVAAYNTFGPPILKGLEAVKSGVSAAFTFIRDWVVRNKDEILNVAETIGSSLLTAYSSVKDAVKTAFGAVKDAVKSAVEFIGGWIDRHRDDIEAFAKAWRNIGVGIATAVGAIVVVLKTILVPAMKLVWDVVKAVWPGIKQTIEGVLDAIGGIIQIFSGIFTGDFSRIWDGVKDIFKGAIKAVLGILRGLGAAAATILKAAGGLMKDAIIAGLKGLARLIWDFIKAAVSFVTDGDRIASVAKGVGGAIGSGIIKGLGSIGHMILGKLKDALGFVADNLPGPAGVVGKAISKVVGDGVGKAAGALGSALPSGTFGGGLMGARPSMAPFAAAASRFGLHVSSGLRPGAITSSGNVSYHSSGEAIDVAGNPAGMLGFFRQMKSRYGSRLAELIYTPGGTGVKDGHAYTYGGQVAADHYDHVHVAYATGAPGVGDGTGRRMGDGLGRFDATSYGPPWGGIQGTGVTATGVNLKNNPHIYGVAVDPNVIPLGAELKITPNPFGYGGTFKAFDTGGAIKGHRIDFYDWRGRKAQNSWGHRSVSVSTAGGASGKGGAKGKAKTYKKNQTASGGPVKGYDPTVTYADENDAFQPPTLGPPAMTASGFSAGTRPSGRPLKGGGPTKGLTPDEAAAREALPEPPAPPTQEDFLQSGIARARLTPGTEDDVAALSALVGLRKAQMDAALADTDPRNDADAIDAYLQVKDALKQLTDSIDQSNELQRQRDERDIQIADNQLKILALANQGPQLMAAVIAAVSGGIGGKVGLGMQTPGYAGGVARY